MRLTLSGLMLAFVACSQSGEAPPRACTMMGCEDGLQVRFGDDLGQPLAVEVSALGEETQRVTCGTDRRCDTGVFFSDFTAAEVTVRVTTANGTLVRTARPVYMNVQPNGPDCPPTCRQGEVVVSGTGGSSGGSSQQPWQPPAPRPNSIVDTLSIEGTPEPMVLRLARPAGAFALPVSTYVPEFLRAQTVADTFRITPATPSPVTQGARIDVVVYPEGTTRERASARLREVAARGDGVVLPLERPHAYALEGLRFRRPGDPSRRLVGWVELGRRDGRYFHVLVQYPAEMGDGMAPRVAAILRHWRWQPSGEPLAL